MDIYRLEGLKINSLADFHEEARRVFDFGEYYGANIYALRDFLSTELPRPLQVIWSNARHSKAVLGEDFDRLVSIFQDFALKESGRQKGFFFTIMPDG
jgi:ribonuclease inhibitor